MLAKSRRLIFGYYVNRKRVDKVVKYNYTDFLENGFYFNEIKMTEVYGQGNTINGVTQSPRSVDVSIARIFSKINISNKNSRLE